MGIIQKYGYIPNNSARYLKRTDGKCIAVLVKGLTNPFFAGAIKIMEDEIKKKKYSMVIRHVESDEDEVDVALELVKEKRLAGLIFLGGHFVHSEEKLSKLRIPFILSTVGEGPDGIRHDNYSTLSVDDEKEGYRMTDYLIRLGHRKIAVLAAEKEDVSIGRMRLMGYLRALRERGIEPDEGLICYMNPKLPSYSMENGYVLTRQLLDEGKEFTAVFAFSGGNPETLQAGPSLMFITLPKVFASMGLGTVTGIVFFVLVLLAALTSAVSLMETSVSTIMDELHWGRKGSCALMAVVMIVLGTASSMGYGLLDFIRIFGMNFLDFFDFATNSVMMPLAALATCILVLKVVGINRITKEIEQSSPFRRKKLYKVFLKYFAPACLIIILLSSIANVLGIISM